MLSYPIAYGIVWALPTGIRIYQASRGVAAPWQVQTVDKASIVAQGLIDAIIYGANETSLSSWRNLFSRDIPISSPSSPRSASPSIERGEIFSEIPANVDLVAGRGRESIMRKMAEAQGLPKTDWSRQQGFPEKNWSRQQGLPEKNLSRPQGLPEMDRSRPQMSKAWQ